MVPLRNHTEKSHSQMWGSQRQHRKLIHNMKYSLEKKTVLKGTNLPGEEKRELTFQSVFRTDPKLHWCLTSVHNKHYKKQTGMCSLASFKQQLLMQRNTEGNRAESGKAHTFSWNSISNFHFWRQSTKLVQTYSSSKWAFLWCYGHTKTLPIEKRKDSKI